ncbi:caspase family protein [Streptomyces sp. NPDC059534]|uniref:HD domain-containing protein n=1 Tax=Streptomyces sp. NPDC059534 TaxID=3346859 RepID=UPI003687A252
MSTTAENGTESGTGPENRAPGVRRALLIGIRDTPSLAGNPRLSKRFPSLECVDDDVRRIEQALRGSGYQVTSFHPGHPLEGHHDTSKDMITQAMEDFLGSCDPGDTALVYVSGHGVSIDHRDYVLPSSARHRAADDALIPRTLIETTVPDLLGEVPEGVSVVVCLDICRTDTPGTAPNAVQPMVGNAHDGVAWLFATGRGEAAFADPERGSHFGLALSEALSPVHTPQTLGEVREFVQARVHRFARNLDGRPPAVELRTSLGRADWWRELPVCDGSEETDRWERILSDSVLWRHTSGGPEAHERVKTALAVLTAEVARSRVGQDAELTAPWHDPSYPERVVNTLGLLVEGARLSGSERLSPAETAALLAAPLLHEGVVAVALSELAELRPERLDRPAQNGRGTEPDGGHARLVCDAAADVCRAHSRVHLTATTLRRRKLTDAALAADHWLRHRFIADWDRLWDRTPDYPAVNRLLDLVVTAVSAAAEGTTFPQPSIVDRHVRRVLPHMTVAPGSSPRIDDSGSPDWGRYDRPVPGNSWRGRELAFLLWLAALLAADPRRMSSVLVDHLGAHEPLTAAAVVGALGAFGCEVLDAEGDDTTTYAMRLTCPHPALHAALEELAAIADGSVRALHRSWYDERRVAPDLLRGVPRRVTTEFLEPAGRSYTKPLERFRLAEDEIRPLLMGTQLYGDRMLAVRELYQNALDACRHWWMRREYGREQGRFRGTDDKPRIHFVQAYDGDRPYIECRDEGSGMSREKLTSMFARAGKRYEQDPDFVQERRNWRRAGLKPLPFNSRFGIGVFSYFMLAEEVVVSTSAVDLYGNPSRTVAPLKATVQSGSGLLQIGDSDTVSLLSGTAVRLYLNAEPDEEAPPSVVETLRRLLWVSDFPVTAVEHDRQGNEIRSEVWEPDVLRSSKERAAAWFGPPVRAGEDSWIVQGKGQILLDGVVVEDAAEVTGYVFNLRERHRPVPSVNRNSLLSYAESTVREEILAGIPQAARAMDEVSVRWLWGLSTSEPRIAVRLFDHLSPETVGVLGPDPNGFDTSTARSLLRHAGVLAIDTEQHATNPASFTNEAGRRMLRRWRLHSLGMEMHKKRIPASDQYPRPVGLDSVLISTAAFVRPWIPALEAAALADVPLADTVRALRRYAIAGARVPAVRNHAVLRDVDRPGEPLLDLCRAYERTVRSRPDATGPAPHAALLAVAALHDVAPAELLPDLRVLLSLGVDIPDAEALESVDLSTKFPAPQTALLTTEDLDMEPWLPATVHPVDLLVRAPRPSQRHRLAERITSLEPLGFRLAADVGEEVLDHRALTSVELKLLSRDSDGTPPWLPSGRVVMRQLLNTSAELRRTLGDVVREINALTHVTGVSAPDVPAECASWIPAHWSALAALRSGRLSAGAPLSSWALVNYAHRQDPRPTSEQFRRELTLAQACGLLDDPVDVVVDQYEHYPPTLVHLLEFAFRPRTRHRHLHGSDGTVSVPLLLSYAAGRRITFGAVLDELTGVDTRLPLHLPRVPEEARRLSPTPADLVHLISAGTGQQGFRSELTCRGLLSAAQARRSTLGEAAAVLAAYHCLGAPPVPGELTAPLAELVPTDFDVAAFESGLLGPGVLGPLELVLVAGRFGWTIGRTYDRYAPFAALGLDVTVREPEDEIRDTVPHWRDVIVLTRELTGRAPALSGTVAPEHVVLCSEETEESEEEVLARLGRYRRLFDLTLPAPGGPRA